MPDMDITAAIAALNQQAEAQGWEQFCDPDLSFTDPDFAAVLALWKAHARGRALPLRTDMSARVLKTYLPHISLKERVQENPSRYRWRLIGTRVAQIIGERTGKFSDENAPPLLAARWIASCDLILAIGMPLRIVGRVLADNKDYLSNDLLVMPLADAQGAPRFVMGFGHYSADRPWRQIVQGMRLAEAARA
jgi:hypothetical protein